MILTFFSWPGARRGHRGVGQIEATAFAISPDSVGYWLDRFKEQHVTAEKAPARFDEEVIRFTDPDGLLLELVTSAVEAGVSPANTRRSATEFWIDSPVPAEHSLRIPWRLGCARRLRTDGEVVDGEFWLSPDSGIRKPFSFYRAERCRSWQND
jgi:catechol 2,3-dioxygenase-like lactoylglutathione lyase family enzyme